MSSRWRQRDKNLTFGGVKNLREVQMAFAFLSFEIAGGDQAAEPAIGGAIGRIGQHFEAIGGHQSRTD